MNFSDCIEFANKIKTANLATMEGDQPRTRPLGMWFADENGFYFQTETVKAVCQQIQKNNKVEFSFFDPSSFKVLRVTGKAEFIDDMNLKKKVFAERPFLKEMGINTPEDARLIIFRISKGEAYFWTMADSMKEADIPRIKFG
jgi:pyridoxamine 5'-phosphate oxidase